MRAIIILGGWIRKVELIHHPEEGVRGRWVTVRGKHDECVESRGAVSDVWRGKVPHSFELTPTKRSHDFRGETYTAFLYCIVNHRLYESRGSEFIPGVPLRQTPLLALLQPSAAWPIQFREEEIQCTVLGRSRRAFSWHFLSGLALSPPHPEGADPHLSPLFVLQNAPKPACLCRRCRHHSF
jgi:hypothetical protein